MTSPSRNGEPTLTHDGFLDGRIRAWQPAKGYRAATDAVFLAAACPAKANDTVLELGCGAGVASLCLATRVPGLLITGVELQPDYAALAQRNAHEAGLPFEVAVADLADLPPALRTQSFDHVIANPTYFATGRVARDGDKGRALARHEDTPLSDWITTGRKRLRPRGALTVIFPMARMPDLLRCFGDAFGDIWARPLAARAGRAADRVVITARKGSGGPFRLLTPVILHDGARHEDDGDDYAPDARNILRHGQALSWI